MSSAGSTGHKSSFPDRPKTQPKSPLPPKRPWVGNSQPRMHRGPDGAAPRLAHSLFGEASPTSSPSRVRQRRVAYPEEPTTPTRNCEGGGKENIFQRREQLKDDSSNFTKGRIVVTPVKTLRPGVGATPPRSPKRPYLGSPKYQKVILERPAFYSAAEEEPKSEQPKKEVSIAELQHRLKKFLQDDATATTLEVPFTISSSPRVNPLFHHDHTPLQVAKGGVAFTAGASDESQTLNHSPRSHLRSEKFKEVLSDDSCTTMEGEMESSVSQPEIKGGVPVAEVSPLPRLLHVAKGGVSFTAGASEEFVSDSTETLPDPNLADFSVHSEVDTCPPQLVGNMQNGGNESVEHTQAEGEMINRPELAPTVNSVLNDTLVDSEHDEDCNGQNRSGVTELLNSNFPAKDSESVTTCETPDLQTVLEADFDLETTHGSPWERFEPEQVDDEIDFEEDSPAVQSWLRRLLNNIMLLFLVASLMGVMVLASGSQGLLPEGLHANPLAKCLHESSLSTPLVPISTGMEGLWKQNGKFPSQPFSNFRTEFLGRMLAFDFRELEGFADDYANGYPSFSLSKHEFELSKTEDLKDQDDLRAQFQDLRGKLFSNVAGLTSDMTIYEPSEFEMQMSRHIGECLEDETKDGTRESLHPQPIATWSKSREECSPEEVGDSPLVEIGDPGSRALEEIPIPVMEVTEENSDVVAPSQSALRDLVHSVFPHQFSGVSAYTLEEQVFIDVQEAGQQPQIAVMTLKEDFVYSEPDVVEVLSVVETTEFDISTIEPASVLETIQEVSRVKLESPTDNVPLEFPILTSGETYSPKVDIPGISSDKLFDTAPEDSQISNMKDVPVSKEIVVESAKEIPDVRANQTKETVPTNMTTSKLEEASLSSNSVPFKVAVSILLAALTLSFPFFLKYHKNTKSIERKDVNTPKESVPVDPTYFPVTETLYKPSISSAPWPSTPSVYDTHIPDKQELDAISSPVSRVRTPGKSALQNYSKGYSVALPAMSAPAYVRPASYSDEKSTSSAQTWHYPSAVRTFDKTTSSSSFRQTPSYMPSESGMSSTGRGSEVDSVAESVLSMGSEESEELGSFTTCELISVSEGGGGEQMRRLTPVRRSKRIRNQSTSPLPARFSGVAL